MARQAKRIRRVRPGQLVSFRLPVELVKFLDEWSAGEHTSRTGVLVRLLVMAKAGAGLADGDAAPPLFRELEGQVEAMVVRAVQEVKDQQERERRASMALGGVVSSKKRRVVRK